MTKCHKPAECCNTDLRIRRMHLPSTRIYEEERKQTVQRPHISYLAILNDSMKHWTLLDGHFSGEFLRQ